MSVLRDLLVSDPPVVFYGTVAGSVSAKQRAYYAGPGNAFWRTLFEVGLTPRLLRPAEYGFVPQYGLGLTDRAKPVLGSDTALQEHFHPYGLQAKISTVDIGPAGDIIMCPG